MKILLWLGLAFVSKLEFGEGSLSKDLDRRRPGDSLQVSKHPVPPLRSKTIFNENLRSGHVWPPLHSLGRILGIISQAPNVSKSNGLQVVIF